MIVHEISRRMSGVFFKRLLSDKRQPFLLRKSQELFSLLGVKMISVAEHSLLASIRHPFTCINSPNFVSKYNFPI
jgi:hypothetical protein